MVFQDPFASLNPFHTVEHHLARPLRMHRRTRTAAETHQACSGAARTGQPDSSRDDRRAPPARAVRRAAPARRDRPRARARRRRCSSPTNRCRCWTSRSGWGCSTCSPACSARTDLAVLYITHDLATARHFSDEILVLYRGRVVERGPADDGHPRAAARLHQAAGERRTRPRASRPGHCRRRGRPRHHRQQHLLQPLHPRWELTQ